MIELQPTTTDQRGRTYHKPVLTQIVGVSQYNSNQFRLQDVEGFWQEPLGKPVPPRGTVAWFTLATKPKGGNAAPGSVYRDIVEVIPATDEDLASYGSTSTGTPDWGNSAPEAPAASPAKPGANNVEQRILQGMAYNNLTVALAAGKTAPVSDGLKRVAELTGKDPVEIWAKMTAAALAGDLLPLVIPEPDTFEGLIDDEEEEEVEESPWEAE